MTLPILLVEDDLALSEALTSTIHATGLPVEHCTSGELAIDLVRERNFAVAVIDIVLGIGVSGLYVINAIRQLPASRRPEVVVITGGKIESLRGVDRSLVAAVLLKPLNLPLFADYVLATYRHAIANRPQPTPPVQTFCGSCKSPITPWLPDRLPIANEVASAAAFDRWLDTPCVNCGALPRVAGGLSAWSH